MLLSLLAALAGRGQGRDSASEEQGTLQVCTNRNMDIDELLYNILTLQFLPFSLIPSAWHPPLVRQHWPGPGTGRGGSGVGFLLWIKACNSVHQSPVWRSVKNKRWISSLVAAYTEHSHSATPAPHWLLPLPRSSGPAAWRRWMLVENVKWACFANNWWLKTQIVISIFSCLRFKLWLKKYLCE